MQQMFPAYGFKWRNDKFILYEDIIQRYDKNREKEYILELDVEYTKELQKAHNYLSFLTERMNIGKYQKLVCNLHGEKNMSYT